MLAMLSTWQSGDVSKQERYNGDFEAAMKGIKAKTLVLPAKTDLYFREFGLEGKTYLQRANMSAQLPKIPKSKSRTCGRESVS